MNKTQLDILWACVPRSSILAMVAIPVTYMLGGILPINSFLVVWGSLFGLALAAQLFDIYSVIRDVRALILEPNPEINLANAARVALRRTFSPAVMMVAMATWVLDSSLTGAVGGIRPTSEWLLYYLIVVFGINAWFDMFDKHRMLTSRQLHIQGEEDGTAAKTVGH